MNRKQKLQECVENNDLYYPLIDKILYLEQQLEKLQKLPKIRVSDKNPALQKATPAAKLYKEYLQQYINSVKLLGQATKSDNETEESPLREWLKKQKETP